MPAALEPLRAAVEEKVLMFLIHGLISAAKLNMPQRKQIPISLTMSPLMAECHAPLNSCMEAVHQLLTHQVYVFSDTLMTERLRFSSPVPT